ncbi:fimbrillin family protein [Parabacteroides bouchesdurhonensis]|uniref:fimbrillin family protein n=1 Tax=Parabacteroides bouchesdurhonensis TaxID=1936995 RepID=UPI00131C60EC|nr:fimbrillin family protein [Parabacteroides bouchesdurhonensis]
MGAKLTYALSGALFLLFAACNDEEQVLSGSADCLLRPAFEAEQASAPVSRSVISGIGSATANGTINSIKLFLTKEDHSAYTGNESSVFSTANGTSWTGSPEIKLSGDKVYVYAFYPTSAAVTRAAGANTHTIPVSVPAIASFDGSSTWNCSTTDYLYGVKPNSSQEETVTASNRDSEFSPSIYMRHALAQVVFKLQASNPNSTYDYVKEIRLSVHAGNAQKFRAGSGTMQIKDGALSLTDTETLTFRASVNPVCATTSSVTVGYGLAAPLAVAPENVSLTIVLGEKGDASNDRTLTATNTGFNIQWQKGHIYTYNLKLKDRNLTLDGAITDWVQGDPTYTGPWDN